MKYFYTKITFLFLLVSGTLLAQQLPNSDFEDWSGEPFDGVAQPAYWHYSNVTQLGFNFNFAHRESGRSGSCMMVQDQALKVAGIGETSPGYISLGQPWVYISSLTKVSEATAGTHGGVAWHYRPDTMVVWIKRTGNNAMAEDFHLLYYAWSGTAHGDKYKGKNGDCTEVSWDDEESDIRQSTNGNECGTTTAANQVAEGWYCQRAIYNTWTQIKVPILYVNSTTPEKMNVIFSASNYPNYRANDGLFVGNSLYVDDVHLIYSSKIQQLYVAGTEWKQFNPNATSTQYYVVDDNVTSTPAIKAYRGVGQFTNSKGITTKFLGRQLQENEISIEEGVIDKTPTTITVYAEDGSNTTTYQILFMHKASNNAKLDGIQANGQAIKNFNQHISDYTIEVPYGSAMPTISVTTQEEGQTVDFRQPTSIQDVTVITVTAPDHTTTKTYTLRYKEALLSDNTLKGISVNGTPVANFMPTKTNYVVNLPLGTSQIPVITPISFYPDGMQTIQLTPPDTIMAGSIYTISVTSPGNTVPMVYQLRFQLVQSSNCQLQAIFINGESLANFSPTVRNYQVTLPEGTTVYPQVTYTEGDAYQTVQVQTNLIMGITRLIVTAISGNKMTYTIQFLNAPIPENILRSIHIAEIDSTIDLTQTSERTFSIDLPYGSKSCSISYTKNYEEQTVLVQAGGTNHPTIVSVYPNTTDGQLVIYTIVPKVSTINPTYLHGIKVDGTVVSNFQPNQFSYIVNRVASTQPKIEVENENGSNWTDATDPWQSAITVTNGIDTNTYRLYFHYPNDTIPNGEFNQWGKTTISKTDKPLYWNTPGDYVSRSNPQWIGVIYNTSTPEETVQKENASVVHLNTTYYACLASAFPSAINLASMKAELGVAGKSNLSVSNGIVFHNTPDNAVVNYKYPNQAGNGALFQFKFTDTKSNTKNYQFTSSETSSYSDYSLALGTDGSRIQEMDIIVNATNQYTGASAGANLFVDYIRFTYNNALTDVFVNGEQATRIGNKFSYTFQSSLDTQEPQLTFKGEVSDQAQSVAWQDPHIEGSFSVQQAIITNYGEDGQSSTYQLTIRRPLDTNTTLKAIAVGGEVLPDFDPYQRTYTYYLHHDVSTIPDITTELQNSLQTCSLSLSHTTATIQVQSERGDICTYTIHFVANPTLSMLSYNGEEVPGFEENQFAYTVQLKQGETMWPAISYVKADPNLMVDITYDISQATASIQVVSSDRSLQNIYTLTFLPYLSNNAMLKDLQISNYPIEFHDSVFIYHHLELDSLYIPAISYTLAEPKQTVGTDTTFNFNTDSTYCSIEVRIIVTAEDTISTETYSIQFEYFNPNTYLKSMLIRSHPLDTTLGFTCNFNPEQLDYYITYPVGTSSNRFFTGDSIAATAQNTHAQVVINTDTIRSVMDTTGTFIPVETNIYIVVQADNHNRTYTIHQKLLLDSLNHVCQLVVANQQGELTLISGFTPNVFYYEYVLSDTRNNAPDFKLIYSNTSSPFAYTGFERINNFRIVDADDHTNYENDNSENDPTYHIFYCAENGTKYTYKIKFRRTEIKRAQIPMEGDVLIQPIPGSTQIAVASLRANVMFGLYDMAGSMVEFIKVPEGDPNSFATVTDAYGQTYFGHLTDFSSCTILTLEPNKIYFWLFTENGKRKIKSGKIIILP